METVSSRQRDKARPMTSKPGPMLAEEQGVLMTKEEEEEEEEGVAMIVVKNELRAVYSDRFNSYGSMTEAEQISYHSDAIYEKALFDSSSGPTQQLFPE